MKSILLFFFSFVSFWAIQAQDIHFTQFTLQGLQQSPALAGNFDGNFRFAALYRNQWATIAVPYNTLGFQFDGKVYETKKFTSFLASGLLLAGDQAGDAQLRTYQAQIPLSYTMYLALTKQTSLKIGSGLYAGLIHKSININNLQFDNQYNGDFFDPQIAIAENFGALQITRTMGCLSFFITYGRYVSYLALNLAYSMVSKSYCAFASSRFDWPVRNNACL